MSPRAAASLFAIAIAATACSGNGDDPPSGPTQPGPGSFQIGIPTFTEGLTRPPSGFAATRWPYGCVVADFDGDGVQDAFVVERFTPTYSGSGAFVWGDATGNYSQRDVVTEPDLPSACAAADFDGDGDLDVAVARSGASTGGSWLFENLGDRRFAITSAGAFDTAEYAMAALVAFDADGDGDVDLIAGCVEPHYGARFFRNDGTGAFVEDNTRLPPRFPPISRVTHGDLDGDGHDDLVLTGAVWTEIWRNDGTGHFVAITPTVLPQFAGTAATDHDLLDADGDGDLDIAFAYGGLLRVLLNDGTFLSATPAVAGVTTVRAGDLDGDGDVDLATVGSGGLRLRHNNGAGAFGNVTPYVQGITTFDAQAMLLCTDLDGNGIADLFVSRGERGLRVLRGITGARFAPTPEYGTTLDINHVATGDVDGDGDVDLMTIVGSSGVVRLNDGAARFTTGGGFALPPGTNHPSLGDFDGDGVTDLLTESGWIQGDGSGRFIAPFEPWPANLASIREVTLIETNGNGRPEAILFGIFGLALVETDGTRLSLREIRTVNVRDVVAGDFDGDGLDDLVVGSPYIPTLSLLLATGDGGFRDATERLPSGSATPRLAADLDVDGDVDLVTPDSVLMNDGNASFTSSPIPSFGSLYSLRTLGAFEGGGPPDLVAVSSGMGHHAINKEIVIGHANGAGGYVLHAPFPTIRPNLSDLELADLDGDRDLDIVWAPGVSTTRGGSVFVNEHRALQSSGVAQRGHDYVLQLQQAAGYATSTRAALMTIGVPGPPVPVAGVGTLHVTDAFLVVPLTLPAPAGRIELRFPVPAAIGAGVEIAAQATFLTGDDPMGLSNPAIDVIY